jgi:hypothetical protein
MGGDDFIQATVAVNVQVVHPTLQVHGKDQSHQPEVMVAVQVADKDMVDPMKICLQSHQLHLSSLATINKKMTALYFNKLACGVSSVGRQGAA